MSEELKTLKEIDFDDCRDWNPPDDRYDQDGYSELSEEKVISRLREEAIKWAKWVHINSYVPRVYERETKSPEESYMVDPVGTRKLDIEDANRLCDDRIAIRGWIMDFFNLTEEDLR